MQELEKILEEIGSEFDRRIGIQLKIMAGLGDDVYRYGYGKSLESYQQGKLLVTDIIRKHMNDGWIPVEERLPIPNKEVWVTVKRNGTVFTSTDAMTKNGCFWNYEKENILAWKEKDITPDPYQPNQQNKPEEHYPEWRTKLLNKFDRRE